MGSIDLINLVLILVIGLNLMFSLLVLSRNTKNTTNVAFFIATLGVNFWNISMLAFRGSQDQEIAAYIARFLYFFASTIPFLFLYFIHIYPNSNYVLKTWQKYILPIPFLIIALLTFIPDFLIRGVILNETTEPVILFNLLPHIVYVVYIVAMFSWSFMALINKYIKTFGTGRKQLIFIWIGTFITASIGMVTNLIMPLFGNFTLNWFGQIGTVFMVASITYAILKHHLFNIKAILAEILAIAIIVVLLVELSFAGSVAEVGFKALVLMAISIFSYILVRGIAKEIEIKEKVSGLVHDIATANQRLRQLEKQKSEFVSIASHQLRTPLTAIKGYTSMLLEGSFGKIPKETNEAIQTIFNSSQRLVALVEDLLTVSRIEQGRIRYEFSNFDIREIVDKVIKDKALSIDEKGLKLFFRAEDGNIPYMVRGDVTKLKQVINNILDNAVKYTVKGIIRVSISKDDAMGKIRISVSDTGVGMDAKTIEQVFKMFNKQHSASKASLPVSGIGLYVARQIIKAHRGRIWAESPGVGQGTTFFIEINAAGNTEEISPVTSPQLGSA